MFSKWAQVYSCICSRTKNLHLMNGELLGLLFWESCIPFWEDELSKQGFKQRFATISVMARIFDIPLSKRTSYVNPSKF